MRVPSQAIFSTICFLQDTPGPGDGKQKLRADKPAMASVGMGLLNQPRGGEPALPMLNAHHSSMHILLNSYLPALASFNTSEHKRREKVKSRIVLKFTIPENVSIVKDALDCA
jgi:hypothetical protein